jgi:glycosyltransferase involved in cell wall biosynthesis
VLSKSEYFDSSYYGQQVETSEARLPKDLVGHYAQIGWRSGLDPHPGFSTNGYLSENPDVWKAGVNPLAHYEEWGKAEERNIVSVAEYENRPGGKKIIRRVTLIDLAYYQFQVPREPFPDALVALDHYLATGWRDGLDPNPSFSTRGYLHDNWDVAADGIDPLTHFVHHGFFEGRSLVDPVAFAKPAYRRPDSPWAADIRESLTLYLQHLGIDHDVSNLDFHGDLVDGEEDLTWFDSDFYLGLYDDVASAGVSALTHFVFAGHREGRFPNALIRAEQALRTDTERILLSKSWSEHSYDEVPDSGQDTRTGASVVAEIVDRQLVEGSRVIIAFAHDDYAEHVGGIQIVSAREQRMFRELGDTYVSVFPNRPLLALSTSFPEEFLVRCRIGDQLLEGTFSLVDFAGVFREQFASQEIVVVMHSVLGHSPEAVRQAIAMFDVSNACWWVHDYSAHCQNYRLTRNGVNSCGDPAPESQSCQVCTFGPVRQQHVERVRSLIDSVSWIFAAPSDAAANQSVSGYTPLPRRPVVIPHGEIVRDGVTREACSREEKVRVAFVGHPAMIKGWRRFIEFVSDAGIDAEHFEFFHFGLEDQSVPEVTFVGLRPESGGRSVATKLLIDHRIDAVMNLVEGKETFNFVTFEAMAAGCCVITSPRSGNVIAAATAENLLIEIDDDFAAFDYLALRDEIRSKRRTDIGEFRITGLTPKLLSEAKK